MKYLIILILSVTVVMAIDSKVKGDVSINGKEVKSGVKVNLGDFIKTGKKSKIVFNVGEDAFMAKENTEFKINKKDGVQRLNIISGGILSVFKKGNNTDVITENMTAGIRGTGVYMESLEGKSYFCLCYGETDFEIHKTQKHKSLEARHHQMIWVKKDGTVKKAKVMRNHNDDELRELENFVGRVPTFDKWGTSITY